MSKISSQFGDIIKSFLQKNNLTYRGAALQSGISAAYWKDMSDGRVPSEEVIAKISACFEDLDENELRSAAGYALKTEELDTVQAVEFALRGYDNIPEEGKKQILDFVREIQKKYIS